MVQGSLCLCHGVLAFLEGPDPVCISNRVPALETLLSLRGRCVDLNTASMVEKGKQIKSVLGGHIEIPWVLGGRR